MSKGQGIVNALVLARYRRQFSNHGKRWMLQVRISLGWKKAEKIAKFFQSIAHAAIIWYNYT